MRHGKTKIVVASAAAAAAGASRLQKHPCLNLCNILLVASLTKTLRESGTRKLDPKFIPITDHLVLQILRRSSIEPFKKLEFFQWCLSLRPTYKPSAAAYSQILHSVSRAGLLGEIQSLLGLMKRDGVVLDEATLKYLLDCFIPSGKFDSALEILDYMEDLGAELTTNVYDSVLIALVRKNQLGMALSIFLKLLEACSNDDNVGLTTIPGSVACNELLVALRKADMRVEFKRAFSKIRANRRFEFDTWGYNICIHALGCWGDLDASLRLFKEMKDKSLVSGTFFGPDLCTYNSLIHVLCLVGKAKDALVVWEELKASGHDPDAFTYRIMVQGCCKSYQMDNAIKIFNEMQYNGFLPDTIVYNSLLDGMLKARKLTEACKLFEKMVQDGIKASSWTYNILIDGLFKNGRAEAGYTLFCDLKKKGQFVDAITYSTVALQLCREGKLEEALQLVEEMETRGFPVDLVTVSSLLIGFHRHGQWDSTDRLMKFVREGNIVPSVLKWKADMEATLRSPQSRKKDYTSMFPSDGDLTNIVSMIDSETDNVEDGETSTTETDPWSSSPYMDRLASQTNRHPPLFSLNRGQRVQEKDTDSFDADMMNTFLSMFLSKGNLSLACKLFEIFRDMGVDYLTSYSTNSMMSSFVKKGYFKEAYGLFNQMGEILCPTDIATFNIVIQGLGRMGRADLASAVLDRLTKHGGYLDVVMYNTLINTLGKAGRFEEANKLFEQIRSNGINPDVVTYNTMIEVYSKAGRLKEAYKFLKMMLDAGCSPNHVTDTILDYLGKEMEKLRFKRASFVKDTI